MREGGHVPFTVRAEFANGLQWRYDAKDRRGSRWKPSAFMEALTLVHDSTEETVCDSAIELAEHHGLTVYDAIYLDLRNSVRQPLATFDKKLIAASRRAGIHLAVSQSVGIDLDLLRDNELIYGRLLPVEEPHLIDRYNKALTAFGLKPTKLKSFEIDRTGFSPEIAEELGDYQYLDPNEVNRRFIILTPAQQDLPVVHTAFSNTSQLVYEFFQKNARAIDALTIKDVIYGEIEDSVSKVEDIEDLISINQVEFRVLSAEDVLGKASELGRLVDRLKQEPDAWRDDKMLNRMVELAKVTGDIRENALVPDQVIFRHNAFWTSHFGGLYVFVDPDMTTVISDPAAPGFRRSRPWQVSYLSIRDADRVFRFLASTGRIELPRASWIETSGYLEHRAEMAIRSLIRDTEPKRDLRQVRQGLAADLDPLQCRADRQGRHLPVPQRGQARDRAGRPVEARGRLPAAPLPGGAGQARPSRRLAHQPADLGFRAVRLRLALHLQQAGFLQGL